MDVIIINYDHTHLYFLMVFEPKLTITYHIFAAQFDHNIFYIIAWFDHIWAFPFDNIFAWLNT